VSRRLRALAVFATLAIAALAGCGGDPVTKQYVFQPDDSSIQVDSPQLRHLKASAGIKACPQTTAPVAAGSRALPDITLPCLGGGRPVNIARLRGPLVLNLWAQWCEPCRDETKALTQVAAEYGDKVQVIGVDWQDTKPDWALAMLRANDATYPQLADPDAATRGPLSIRGMPTTFFVTRNGSVSYVNNGPFDSADDLRQAISDHLGVSAPVKLPKAGT
jgi:thiol-disulfide isomerase/thioredoxin